MRRIFRLLMVMGVSICLFGAVAPQLPRGIAAEPATGSAKKTDTPVLIQGFIVGAPLRHANLTIFPLSSPTPQMQDRFITLDIGLKSGQVEVMEVGSPAAVAAYNAARVPGTPIRPEDGNPFASGEGNATVNQLLVVNRSDKALYLMPGEVIIGGRQDRAVGNEYVIEPGKKPVPIQVYCVEHDRWSNRSTEETESLLRSAGSNAAAAGSVAVSGDVKKAAEKTAAGNFAGSVGSVGRETRLAVQMTKEQAAVWEKIAEKRKKFDVKSSTGTFSANYTDENALKKLEPYIKALEGPIVNETQVVGVLVAVDGRMDSIDVFESTPLFRKLWPKLLKSYVLDAVETPDSASSTKTCSRDDAVKFLTRIATAKPKESTTTDDLTTSSQATDDVILFTVRDKAATRAHRGGGMGGMGGGMGGGAFGGGIHSGGGAF